MLLLVVQSRADKLQLLLQQRNKLQHNKNITNNFSPNLGQTIFLRRNIYLTLIYIWGIRFSSPIPIMLKKKIAGTKS